MKYAAEAKAIWKNHVPSRGQSDTVEGEMIRAIERLRWEAQENGNGNWDKAFKYFCEFLWKTLHDKNVFDEHALQEIKEDIETISKGRQPYLHDDIYDRLTDRVVEWTFVYNGTNKREHDPKQYR